MIKGKVIALNAGHEPGRDRLGNGGGKGASTGLRDPMLLYPGNSLAITEGQYSGVINEHTFNQEIVNRLARLLEEKGAIPILTRVAEIEPTPKGKVLNLRERVEIANTSGAEILLDIHGNGNPNHLEYNGSSTIIDCSQEGSSKYLFSKVLADLVLESLDGINSPEGKIRTRDTFERTDLILIRETTMPAALVECGYMTNEADMNLLRREDYRNAMCEAIVEGVEKYFAQSL
jgi:N-acetylmuramoyl-L-alanine amidase